MIVFEYVPSFTALLSRRKCVGTEGHKKVPKLFYKLFYFLIKLFRRFLCPCVPLWFIWLGIRINHGAGLKTQYVPYVPIVGGGSA